MPPRRHVMRADATRQPLRRRPARSRDVLPVRPGLPTQAPGTAPGACSSRGAPDGPAQTRFEENLMSMSRPARLGTVAALVTAITCGAVPALADAPLEIEEPWRETIRCGAVTGVATGAVVQRVPRGPDDGRADRPRRVRAVPAARACPERSGRRGVRPLGPALRRAAAVPRASPGAARRHRCRAGCLPGPLAARDVREVRADDRDGTAVAAPVRPHAGVADQGPDGCGPLQSPGGGWRDCRGR